MSLAVSGLPCGIPLSVRTRVRFQPPTRVLLHVMRTNAKAGADTGSADPGGEGDSKTIIIVGAGIIGSSIAYHLATNHNQKCTLIDKSGPGAAASGKAGGFLALDWCDGSALGPLVRASFPMHQELAETLQIDSYRRLTCRAVAVDEKEVLNPNKPSNKKLEHVEWADVGTVGSRPMGDENTIAQVHPMRLVEAYLKGAKDSVGTDVVIGDAQTLVFDSDNNKVTGVTVDGFYLQADIVIAAMGPWTNKLVPCELLNREIYGQKYHAVLLRPKHVLSQAVFFQGLGDPEFYPRPDGDVYVCAYPDPAEVMTEEPGHVEVRPDAVDRLINVSRKLSSEMSDSLSAPIKKNADGSVGQSCHLPITDNGVPVMGPVRGISNLHVATGHGCWGILNSPASGAAMAELVANGEVTLIPKFLEMYAPK